MERAPDVAAPVDAGFMLRLLSQAQDRARSVIAGRAGPVLVLASVAITVLGVVNVVGLAQTTLWLIRHNGSGGDWQNLAGLSIADPYAVGGFRWSPPAAWIWVAAVLPLGLPLWQALHLVALALLRDWRVIGLGLLSWAFWQDLANGNVMTFVVVSAWWALRGSRVGTAAFLVLCVLVPRPLMLPVLVWLLVRRPGTRPWFALLVLSVVGLSVATGQMGGWAERLVATGQNELSSIWNIGPSKLIGAFWIPIGVTLAAALAWRGWLGMASIVIAPYLFPYYMLMGLIDVPRLLAGRASSTR